MIPRAWWLLALPLSTAAAQITVSGRVTDATTAEPLAGVVVSGLDAKRNSVARAVSDRVRGYSLVIPQGTARIQFRRIGFSPVEVPMTDVERGHLDVAMRRLPTQLPPVIAVTEAVCDPAPDREMALSLWNEARSGLLASAVARESRPAHVQVLNYYYWFTANGDTLGQTVSRAETDSASTGFVASRPPRELAQRGYVDISLLGRSYLAPDDVVLFDDSFYSTHCFSMDSSVVPTDSLVGVRFQLAKNRDKNPDVEGTAWLTRNPLDLRRVDFHYVNVEKDVSRLGGGGSLEFTPMPNDITMLSRWRIRGVALGRRGAASRANETGGLVEVIEWRTGETYLRSLPTLTGVVRTTDGLPAAGGLVRLANTPYLGRTDSAGQFRIEGVLPGRYDLSVGDPLLVQAGIDKPATRVIDVDLNPTIVEGLVAEPAVTIIRRICGQPGRLTPKHGSGQAAIFGKVVNTSGQPVSTRITATVTLADTTVGSEPIVYEGRTDVSGIFRLCELPGNSTTAIRVGGGDGPVIKVTVPGPADYGTVLIPVGKPPS